MRSAVGPWRAVAFYLALVAFTAFVLLDTFVIPHAYTQASSTASTATSSSATSDDATSPTSQATTTASAVVVTDTTYDDGATSVVVSEYRQNDTTVYVADVTLSDPTKLTTAFAQDTFGRNITATTSSIAAAHSAILAVNGDFYGARSTGYVLRGGVVYRDTAVAGQEDLVIDADGNFSIVEEEDVSLAELQAAGAREVLSFGPALVVDGQVAVDDDDEVDRAMVSNPRTALAQVGQGHYLFVVADGRTEESSGLTLQQLAEFLQSLGAQTAYNLDGGGSSTMYFNGTVVNNPTTNGSRITERSVSDIVYVAS